MIIQHILVIHPVRGLIVWVYRVFVADLLGSVSLLVHVSSANQFCTEVPALPPRQLNVHSDIVIGFLTQEHMITLKQFLQGAEPF